MRFYVEIDASRKPRLVRIHEAVPFDPQQIALIRKRIWIILRQGDSFLLDMLKSLFQILRFKIMAFKMIVIFKFAENITS